MHDVGFILFMVLVIAVAVYFISKQRKHPTSDTTTTSVPRYPRNPDVSDQ